MLCTSTWNKISELALCYENTLTSLLEKHAPLQRKVVVVRPKLPWYTNSLRELKIKRRRLERKMLFTGLHEDKLAYHNTCDEYTKLLSETKRNYYSKQITESAGDTKKLFNIVNSLCKVDDRYDVLPTLDSPQSLANDFGAFLITKIELIQQDIHKPLSISLKFKFNLLMLDWRGSLTLQKIMFNTLLCDQATLLVYWTQYQCG